MGADKTVKQGPGVGRGARRLCGSGAGIAAVVVEERPRAVYVVRLGGGEEVLAHLVGAVGRNFVRLVPGDRVEVELMPHDPTRGRITRKIAGSQVLPGPRPPALGPEDL